MSQCVPTEILALCDLCRELNPPLRPEEVDSFITGRNNPGEVTIPFRAGRCPVVVEIALANVDQTQPNTVTAQSAGVNTVVEQQAEVSYTGPVLYIWKPSQVVLTFDFTKAGADTGYIRVRGYFVPERALALLARCQTEQIPQS